MSLRLQIYLSPTATQVSEKLSHRLAEQTELSICKELNPADDEACFEYQETKLVLHMQLDHKPTLLEFDLDQGEVAIRAIKASKSNEVIAKAIGCKPHYRPRVLDATAGMGRDALMMARLGCRVTMLERNFAIGLLLENALERLSSQTELSATASQLSLQKQDSLQFIALEKEADVLYLDPMFPERKKSALVKKEMRLFKKLAGEDLDADELLLQGLNGSFKRVVVKRPKGAPILAGKEPSHEILAKKFRYDIYLNL